MSENCSIAAPTPAPQGITREALAEAIRAALAVPESFNQIPETIAEHLLAHPTAGPIVRGEVEAPFPQGITPESLAVSIRAAGVPAYFGQLPESMAVALLAHPTTAPLLRGQAIAPTPAAERPWERPGWCDEEGRCWLGTPQIGFIDAVWVLRRPWERQSYQTVSLPADAIQIPAQEGQS